MYGTVDAAMGGTLELAARNGVYLEKIPKIILHIYCDVEQSDCQFLEVPSNVINTIAVPDVEFFRPVATMVVRDANRSRSILVAAKNVFGFSSENLSRRSPLDTTTPYGAGRTRRLQTTGTQRPFLRTK